MFYKKHKDKITTRKERHEIIVKRFNKLNNVLIDKRDACLENISTNINKALKNPDNKNLQKKSYNNIVDLFYGVLTDTYLETTIALKEIYAEISDNIPDIEKFIYKEDKLTLPERIKKYWDEIPLFLKQNGDPQEIALYLLKHYDIILNNEMQNVKSGVKRTKKPIDPDGIPIIVISNGECDCCCEHSGIYLADDDPELPPYHIGCQCDFYYEFCYPTDEADLDELHELGWEDEDG